MDTQERGTSGNHSLALAFTLKDRVLVKEVQRPGRIDSISWDNMGVSYRVVYWDNADRKVAWLYEDEIELR